VKHSPLTEAEAGSKLEPVLAQETGFRDGIKAEQVAHLSFAAAIN